MAIVYLIRHGEADYSYRGTKIFKGIGNNFASLIPDGIKQIEAAATDRRLSDADIIISSPYTRALHSAAILSKILQIDLVVEHDLYEWVPDTSFIELTEEESVRRLNEYNVLNGMHPEDVILPWESNQMMYERLIRTLGKYKKYSKVIVVCHGMLMHSVNPDHWAEYGEIIEFNI